ncbi:MAG: polyhydroxyalkanoate synthesis regulator DNA-binding domain-containing protein [Deltaproteobacteria bacterium]|nr:polyhydroxyalkanoate synthesis regulator DNA-binding domain-containing protein [Deltaproteobacteria bacterium]
MQKEPTVRIIKRYQNRKLYDTINSCYVTLDEIAQMIRDGEDVRIQENRTGKDLTSVTLTQIIFEEEKKHKSLLPLSTLKNIIQSGGESLVGFVQKSLTSSVSSISHVSNNVRGEAERVIDKIRDEFEDGGNLIKDFLGKTNKSIDELQHKVEERFRNPFGTNKPMIKLPNLKTEIRGLRKKLATLERKLRDYKDPE